MESHKRLILTRSMPTPGRGPGYRQGSDSSTLPGAIHEESGALRSDWTVEQRQGKLTLDEKHCSSDALVVLLYLNVSMPMEDMPCSD